MCRTMRPRLTPDERRQRAEQRLAYKLATDPVARRRYYKRRGYKFTTTAEIRDLAKALTTQTDVTEFDPISHEEQLPIRELAVSFALAGFEPESIASAVKQPIAVVDAVLMLHGDYAPHWWAYRFLRRGELRIAARVGTIGQTAPCTRTFAECYGHPGNRPFSDDPPAAAPVQGYVARR